jgi:hypothetical protein
MMYLVFEKETFQRGELTRRIENLSHGIYLPVEVAAFDSYGKGIHVVPPTGIDHLFNLFPSNLRLSVEFISCRRRGTEYVSRLKNSMLSLSRRGVVIR